MAIFTAMVRMKLTETMKKELGLVKHLLDRVLKKDFENLKRSKVTPGTYVSINNNLCRVAMDASDLRTVLSLDGKTFKGKLPEAEGALSRLMDSSHLAGALFKNTSAKIAFASFPKEVDDKVAELQVDLNDDHLGEVKA